MESPEKNQTIISNNCENIMNYACLLVSSFSLGSDAANAHHFFNLLLYRLEKSLLAISGTNQPFSLSCAHRRKAMKRSGLIVSF